MIHPPDVIPKYAPDAIIGTLGAAKAPKAKKAKKAEGGAAAAAPVSASGHHPRDYSKYEANKKKRMEGHGKIGGWFGALCYIVLTNDRVGLTRSAMFLFVFIIIHAVGNLHVFL